MSLQNFMQNKEPSEKEIENEILDWLNQREDCFAYKVNRIGLWDPTTGKYRKAGRFEIKGVADINALFKGGRIVFFEVKDHRGKQREDQKKFEKKVKELGFEYYLVRSLDEVKEKINGRISR